MLFSSGKLNTAINGLIGPGDHVITTVCEHNSVLRPLYRLRQQGAELSFLGVDARGVLQYDQLETLLRPNTKAIVVTHASNVTGNRTDLARVSTFAKRHGLLFIVDAAQTAGAHSIDVQALGMDVLCFTGHKGLLGPQGTGGFYVRPGLRIAPLVVGGLVAWFVSNRSKDGALNKARFDRGTLIASGFIAGGALMGVVSALLKFAEVDWFLSGWAASNAAEWTGLAMYLVLIGYFAWHTLRAKKEE